MNIGFIGLGIMGKPMCSNLVKKNSLDDFWVYDVSLHKIAILERLGAKRCSSIVEVGERCEIIFSIVPKSEHVKAVYRELLTVMKHGQIFVDMSSIEAAVSQSLSVDVSKKGAYMLDCPVVKSREAAEEGTLGIYCGGEKSIYEKVKCYLLCMGKNTIYLGSNGSGTAMKAIHNMLVGQIQNGVNEMLILAQKKGLAIDDFVTAVSYGGAGNFYLASKADAIKNRNFNVAFSIENMHKDVNIAKSLADEAGLDMPGINNVVDVYNQAIKMDLGALDFSASYTVVEKKAGG